MDAKKFEDEVKIAKKEDKGGFDAIWKILPHLSVYQARITAFAGYQAFASAFLAMYPVFAQYKPPTRCATVFDNTTKFDLDWNQIFTLTTDTPDCNGYDPDNNLDCYYCNYTLTDLQECEDMETYDGLIKCTSEPDFQAKASWVECDGYEFDRFLRPGITNYNGEPWETVVTEFELLCDMAWFNSFLMAMAFVGLFLGAFVATTYIDRFGRKNAILVWTAISTTCSVIQAFIPDKYSFLVFKLLVAGANHVVWIAYITYASEVLGPSKRSVAGGMAHVYYSFGYMASSGLAYLLPDWRAFTIGCALIRVPVFLLAFFYPMSSRFLYVKNRPKEGRKVLQEFGKKTKTELSDEFLEKFENNMITESTKDAAIQHKQFSILDLFRDRKMALVAANIGVAFMVNTLVYFGLSYNVAALSGNLYVNNVINGAVELVAYLMCIALLDILGRRFLLSGLMITGGAVCIISMVLREFATDDTEWMLEVAKWLSFLGKFGISGSFCVVYVFAADLFPTEVRSIGIGFGSMIGRIGGFLAPFIILLQDQEGLSFLPYLIFGTSAIASGVWALFLPETAGKPMLQTIEEALLFYGGKENAVSDENETDEKDESALTTL